MANHKTPPKFSAEVRERAVRMVFAHRAVHTSHLSQAGAAHPDALFLWSMFRWSTADEKRGLTLT